VQHSKIVGGSTAKRVINCPGSVALVNAMPPQPSSSYADTGTLLHNIIAEVLDKDLAPESFLGMTYQSVDLTPDLLDDKLLPALELLDEVDPDGTMPFAVESSVNFGALLPGVFGSTDLVGRIGDKAMVLDWKFGDGVPVEAEENEQLMFYAAAARRTPETQWAFNGAKEIELVIIQPPHIRRWVTTPARIAKFEKELVKAVKAASKPDAPLKSGDHCRWCSAAALTCPIRNGEADRALQIKIDALPVEKLGVFLEQAEMLEQQIADARKLAHWLMEEEHVSIPGWKLVPKRATRKWTDEGRAAEWLNDQGVEPFEKKVVSPAAAEKLLKKSKTELPAALVVAVSSGSTLAPESDPRPAVEQTGAVLIKALAKLK
jgi:hypothetical protein